MPKTKKSTIEKIKNKTELGDIVLLNCTIKEQINDHAPIKNLHTSVVGYLKQIKIEEDCLVLDMYNPNMEKPYWVFENHGKSFNGDQIESYKVLVKKK